MCTLQTDVSEVLTGNISYVINEYASLFPIINIHSVGALRIYVHTYRPCTGCLFEKDNGSIFAAEASGNFLRQSTTAAGIQSVPNCNPVFVPFGLMAVVTSQCVVPAICKEYICQRNV
jgi:hypothetical protein